MKVERKTHSYLLRGLLFVMAFAMTVLYFPVSELVAYVNGKLSANAYTFNPANCYFMSWDEGYETTVNKGSDYIIPKAYIGAEKDMIVGDINDSNIKSSVSVTYNGMEVDFTDESASNSFEVGKAFTANNLGTYTVTYEYSYTGSDGKDYKNTYSINVESVVAAATIGFKDNQSTFLPSIIDLSLLASGKDVALPTPYVTDEDGKELKSEDVEFVTSLSEATKEDVVVVSVYGGVAGGKIEGNDLKGDDGKLYIKRAILDGSGAYASFGADDYTVRYSYYKKSTEKVDYQFVSSATKTTTVYASSDPHYKKNYALTLKLGSSWTRTGHQTGVESTLPVATGATSSNTDPANEAVDVYYTVQVKYSSNSATSGYVALTDKTSGYEDVFEGDILKEPTKFKPLANGYYSFIYTVKDVYGNTVSSNTGDYYFDNVEDKTAPTILIYDASVKAEEIKDESWKLASRHAPNSVVVYAIGIKDNVSTASESELTRQILTGDEVKLTIDNYDEFNLIFNYGGSDADSDSAWRSMLTNNYLINKAVKKAEKADANAFVSDSDLTTGKTADEKRLAWLQDNGYLIVVDNANALNMYNYFGTIINKQVSSVTDFNSFKTFLTKTLTDANARKTLSDLGLAYVDCNETFGATTSQVTEIGGTKYYGMGARSYYIRYTATDKAGNKNTKTESMMVSSGVDNDAPTIRFSTTLADKYVPNTTIKIDKPTASDTRDTNMNVVTLYRYLNKTSGTTTVLDVFSEDDEPVKLSNVDITDVFDDLEEKEVKDDSDPVNLLVDKYAKFNGTGYVDLTVDNSTSYSIDLKKAPETANLLQVVSYVYDDYGNLNMYAKEVAIENIKDENPVRFTNDLKIEDDNNFIYNQGDTITLPEFKAIDDAINYVTYDVNAYYVDGDTNISVYETDKNMSMGMFYILNAGKFDAVSAGEYRVSVALKDSENRTIVAFLKYTVSGRTINQAPSLAASLESGSYQLDDNPEINIPTPTVSYNISKSMTKDEYDYLNSLSDLSDAQQASLDAVNYVVVGVDENGAVKENYGSVNVGTLGSVFKPSKTGTYDIVYTAEMTAYNVHMFKYHNELEWNDTTNKYDYGTYYELINTAVDGSGTTKSGIKVETLIDGSYKVTSGSTIYNVSKDENNNIVITKNGTVSTDFTSVIGISAETLYNELMAYRLESDTYTISVSDTTGPKFKENYYEELYSPKLSIEELKANAVSDVYSLKIFGLEATDASGLDESSASIRVTGTLANGNSAPSATFDGKDAIKGGEYKINVGAGSNPDGTYTITYSVKDKKGNSATSKVVTIVIGDVTAPKLKFDDKFFDSDKKYTVGEQLVLDPSLITVTNMDKNQCTTKIEVVADADNKNLAEERNGKYYVDDLQVGTYTITVSVTRDDGPTTTETFKFEVTTETQSNTEVYQIVGIVLIVLSVLVLVGVIVYFVVSKVKLDKELKKK